MNTATQEKMIGPHSTMHQVLEAYPGARRALFRRYHIGGCSSCGFRAEETLEQVCQRNNNLNIDEVTDHIRASHELDLQLQISPAELAQQRQANPSIKLVDVRTREEWNVARIDGAHFLDQALTQEILSQWLGQTLVVFYDHDGRTSSDAAAYFAGHGLKNARCLRGGIDAWSLEVDPEVPRYILEQLQSSKAL
jgi:rhodanese-related sulfurtransferase